MSIFGHIQDMPLPDVLQMVSAGKRSGVLTVVCREGTGRILLSNGRIVYAAADTRKRLGGVLLEKGYITLRELTQTLKEQRDADDRRPLGTLLVEKGLLTQEQLEAVLKPHIVTIFHDFLSWKRGLFYFEKDWLLDDSVVFQEGLGVEQVLLEAVRMQDEVESEAIAPAELWP